MAGRWPRLKVKASRSSYVENLVGDLGSTAEIPGDDGAVGRVPARGVGAAQKLGAFLEEEDVQGLLHGRLVAPHHLQKQTRVLRAGPRGTGRHPRGGRGGPPGAQRTGFGEAGAEGRDRTRPRTPEGRRWCPAVWGRTWERRRLLKPARHARSRRPSRLPPEESLRRWEWASLETAEPAPTRGPGVQAFSLLAPWPTCQSLPPRGPPGSVTRHASRVAARSAARFPRPPSAPRRLAWWQQVPGQGPRDRD